MRLRRIPEAKEAVGASELCFKEPLAMRGCWREIAGERPVYLEIGMGRGAFIIGHALTEPHNFLLGLEFREEMLFLAEKKLREQMALKGLFAVPGNLRFIWGNAMLLTELFAAGEVDNIYLNFSDPWPKARHDKRRLTHAGFLAQYEQILAEGGRIYFRTDNEAFYDWSLSSFRESPFTLLAASRQAELPSDGIISEYEKRYRSLGQPIFTATLQNGGK